MSKSQMRTTMVASLNMLGDAYNPFEFVEVNNAASMKIFESLEARLLTLTWAELDENGLEELVAALPSVAEASAVVAEMRGTSALVSETLTLKTLVSDNKLLRARVNLLVHAMATLPACLTPDETDGARLVWQLGTAGARQVAPWWRALKRCCAVGGDYSTDPKILVWDLASNLVAVSDLAGFAATCESSYLNPESNARFARAFIGQLEAARAAKSESCDQIVLGVQEFPTEGTLKGEAFEAEFRAAGFEVLRGPMSIALMVRGFEADAGDAVLAQHGLEGAVDPVDVMSRVCESAAGQSVEKGERSALVKSTAARTMVVRRAGTLWCVSHFKEAKSDECVDCLPLFFDALRTALDPSKEIPFVLVADTNLSSVAFHDRFRERCGLVSLDVSRAATTTSKRRSLLHGQFFNANKCHVTVMAPKDVIVVARCNTGTSDSLREWACYPVVDDAQLPVTLPTAEWPSDHCLISALVCTPQWQPVSLDWEPTHLGVCFGPMLFVLVYRERTDGPTIRRDMPILDLGPDDTADAVLDKLRAAHKPFLDFEGKLSKRQAIRLVTMLLDHKRTPAADQTR